MRLSIPIAVVAVAVAAALPGAAPAHIDLQTCHGPFEFRNSHDKRVLVGHIDLVNATIDCHHARSVVRNFIDSETTEPWTCRARGIQGTSGSGRGNCLHGHQEMHYPWHIL
jgi:hypothetical protein